MSKVELLALRNPTYESDFWAIGEMLARMQIVNSAEIALIVSHENTTFIVQSASGKRHFHLNKLFAIHHFLSLHYRNVKAQ